MARLSHDQHCTGYFHRSAVPVPLRTLPLAPSIYVCPDVHITGLRLSRYVCALLCTQHGEYYLTHKQDIPSGEIIEPQKCRPTDSLHKTMRKSRATHVKYLFLTRQYLTWRIGPSATNILSTRVDVRSESSKRAHGW